MLNSQLHRYSPPLSTLIPWHKPFISGRAIGASFSKHQKTKSSKKNKPFLVRYVPESKIKANQVPPASTDTDIIVVATVVPKTVGGILSLKLELVAAELDPDTGLERETIPAFVSRAGREDLDDIKYGCEFTIPHNFGEIGAILVENEHSEEMFLKRIELDGFPNGTININCESWVHSKNENPEKRIFFTNKSFLPSKTPSGLVKYRKNELLAQRGDGTGERKKSDRIYDYDVYNDIGDPDENTDLARPILGGKDHPYPRRCRTGRPRTREEPFSESRGSSYVYVPRDEIFSAEKEQTFLEQTIYSATHALLPMLENKANDSDLEFSCFTDIDALFNKGGEEPKSFFLDIIPTFIKSLFVRGKKVLHFETPKLLGRDRFSWMTDEEFGRQTLAGLNPYSIRLVKEWPLKSDLDPRTYGPSESAITKEVVEQQIRGFMMTLEEAIKQKKLFILDYHDLLLPYVNKVRDLEGKTLYGSRTLFFLTPVNTLKPIAIELVRPKGKGKPQWKKVYSPGWDATNLWLWKLAKAHVMAHDSGYHQLVSHWLRTHCATEPYIIAANRQLSAMHPIYRLLHPHFRYTMDINARARLYLINAGGIIESSFSPGKYSMELSSAAYDKLWCFNQEGLPADLISRGMAEEDPTAPHGLKLAIEDYPFASDGLILWDCIKMWVTDYVSHYYPEASLIESDEELNAWWLEIRTEGHADKKDKSWWPILKTPQDLIGILTTIIWVASAHHAAVNFGQYDYAGYFPNRPTIARTKMPTEDPTEESWKSFELRPEGELLSCFPTQTQATTVMTTLDVLSNHSRDEEYIGAEPEPAWADEPNINAAFERFSRRLKEFDGIIDARNANKTLRNRTGAGIVPYQLLKPYSEDGVTGQGVPNSISI